MQLTRQQIIDYLQANRIATTAELSRVLLVTAANIRHHLRLLKEAGMVDVVGEEPARGRGRPKKIFSLTETALKHNLDGLASALLEALPTIEKDSHMALTRVVTYLLGDYQAAKNAHTRLSQSVEKLNQLKYQATWEASPNGPRIILRNCPYATILSNHPELCHLDTALVTRLLDQPAEQSAKLERYPDGSPHCAFVTRDRI